MKKLVLFALLVSISIGAMAQKGKANSAIRLTNEGQLIRAKADLDLALAHRKSANLPITFFAKAQLAQAAFEYENTTLFADPLDEAYAAFEKAMQLDQTKKEQIKRKIISGSMYNALADCFYYQGGEQYEVEDFVGALKSFETQIKIVNSDMYVGDIDTGMYYNAGIAALNAEMFDVALKYFNICADMKYMGIVPHYQIYETHVAKGDIAAAEAVLKSLPSLFPNDKSITLQLIDLYIKSGKHDEALQYLAMAKQDDPTNSIFYFVAGIINLEAENYDEAIVELRRSIELDPDMFDAQYGLGAAYINKAARMFREANDIMDVSQYNAAVDAANEVYANALPNMEKALQLNPDDVYTMQNLKELYYRMGLTEKYDAITAKLDGR